MMSLWRWRVARDFGRPPEGAYAQIFFSQRGPPYSRLPTPQVSGALPADRDKRHQTGFRQWVAPAMARSVLHDAITLAQMDLLPVVQLQCHLAANHNSVVDGVRRSASPERRAQNGLPCQGPFPTFLEAHSQNVTPAGGFQPSGRFGGYESSRNMVPAGPGNAFVPFDIGSGSRPVSSGTPSVIYSS